MRSPKALLPTFSGGLALLAVLSTMSFAAEDRQDAETSEVSTNSVVDGEAYVMDECEVDPSCRVLVPCRALPVGGFWCEADYLLWWTKGMDIPPLVTTGSTGDRDTADTQILYGDEKILDNARSGFRVALGTWLDCGRCFALDGDYWRLGEDTEHFLAASNAAGSPSLFRPFFNINPRDENGDFDPPAREDAEIVSMPEVLAGAVTVDSFSQLQGAGIRLRRQLCCESNCEACCDPCGQECTIACSSRLDFLVGYRFVQLREGLTIREALTSLEAEPNQGDFGIVDDFRSTNSFHGADLGVAWQRRCGPWRLDVLGKLALGSTEQTVTIGGQTVISGSETGDGTYVGGLLAQRTNIGTYQRNVFAVVPELGVSLGFQFSRCLTARVGYNFLYWSRVARPGDQIDLDVNPDLLPPEEEFAGAARPRFEFRDTDFWAHGIRLGLEGTW